jgi:predicted nucleic acid-binding protein
MLLDANVLLRAIDGPQHPQYEQAKAWVDEAVASDEPLRVHPITMMEVSYVLASKPAGYGWERSGIADALTAILEDPTLTVVDAPILDRAVELFRQYPLDLQDCYLAAFSDARQEQLCSFDGDFDRLRAAGLAI